MSKVLGSAPYSARKLATSVLSFADANSTPTRASSLPAHGMAAPCLLYPMLTHPSSRLVFSFLSCLSHPFCHLPHPLFSHLVLLSSLPFRLYTSPSLDTVSHYNSTPSNASQRSVRFTTCIFGTYPSNQRYTISDSPELADLINTEYQIIGITRCGFVVVVMCKGLPPCCDATEA